MSEGAYIIDPDDLEPTIDIDLKTQKEILRLFAMLSTADHYQLLGVPRSAEKSEIRAAYFEKMNLFHSDRFYGKKLGRFGPRLEQIVQKLTKASDTLCRKKTRSEYDEYLRSREKTLGARTSVAPSRAPSDTPSANASRPAVAPLERIPSIPRAPKMPEMRESEPTADSQAVSSSPMSGPRSGKGRPPGSDAAARRLLARKMGKRPTKGRASVPPGGPSSRPPPDQLRRAVQEDMRKRYDARVNPGRVHVDKYVERAEQAVAAGAWADAVNAIKLAAQAVPDDSEVQKRMGEIQDQADQALAPRFMEQARYEEKDGRYDRAARSYERAARGKNSASLFQKAAECLLRLPRPSDDDKRKLVEMARKGVTLDNKHADYRLTLARAYDVAGMRTSAQGEVRRALELEPDNKHAKELQKALK